jgi:hypothetical protein
MAWTLCRKLRTFTPVQPLYWTGLTSWYALARRGRKILSKNLASSSPSTRMKSRR